MGFPVDPFESLDQEHRDLFEQIPGVDYLEPGYETDYAQTLFAVGFGFTSNDYDRMGLDPDVVGAAREQFLAHMQLEDDDFPWDEWKELHADSP